MPTTISGADAGLTTTVEFRTPDKFTDVGDNRPASERSRNAYLEDLRKYLVRDAQRLLPQGQRLAIEITDVDMAGDFEPWRMQSVDLRVVRDIYPPRIDLHFRVVGPDGQVLKEGDRKLRDPAYLMTSTAARFSTDPLRFEKALLDAWLRREFARG